jgi:hypothetical protein
VASALAAHDPDSQAINGPRPHGHRRSPREDTNRRPADHSRRPHGSPHPPPRRLQRRPSHQRHRLEFLELHRGSARRGVAPALAGPTDVPARVAAAGLELGPMGTAEHYHPHLSITIDGQPVPVPPNIGVDPDTGAMSAVHTHEGDGTIHIEAHTAGEKFTLGQLFTQWGVALTPTQIGGVEAKAGDKVTVSSNGNPVSGAPADLRLEPDQKIELTLG